MSHAVLIAIGVDWEGRRSWSFRKVIDLGIAQVESSGSRPCRTMSIDNLMGSAPELYQRYLHRRCSPGTTRYSNEAA
jgi:hypothetical protein